ncbi:hypothetical protein MKQ68_12675 [Chitinophaga horti]|uniref:Uncharacterized protein n=1 Tax=Chitinophaga horti TaxID=2920382 RepID=A0ABY6J8D0_9BACT|nr:hypothetical protein [Chitinophaga horti]UYQ95955.1 hypothetical protein MKQ68_12675 [Chitinophaga horti]
MLNRLLLSGEARYLKVIRRIPKAIIKSCLDEAASARIGHALEKDIRVESKFKGEDFYVSYIEFRTEGLPHFLSSGPERSIGHSYLLILEVGTYLIISKSGGKDITSLLEDYTERLDKEVLTGAYLDPTSDFEKAVAKNISTNDRTMQRQSFEARRLQEVMPALTLSGKLLSNVKHRTRGEVYSITGNTSKVNILNTKVDFMGYVALVFDAIQRFSLPVVRHSFLEYFAIPLDFRTHVKRISPTHFLFLVHEFVEYINLHANPRPQLVYRGNDGDVVLPYSVMDYLSRLSSCLAVKKENGGSVLKIVTRLDPTLKLDCLSRSYKLSSDLLKHIHLIFDENSSENLLSLINRRGLFNLNFDKPDIFYASGSLYKDNKLLGNIDSFLDMFVAVPGLEMVDSEKGAIVQTDTMFPDGSLFNLLESILLPAVDHLVLDDLGYEAADYLTVTSRKKLQLIHGKVSKRIFSASAFQEVIGQALKNLSFFTNQEGVTTKIPLWNSDYSNTSITRIRSGNAGDIEGDILATLNNPNCDHEVILAVNFISKDRITHELTELKAGRKAATATLPILWLLSTLRNSCVERNVKVFIWCRQ